MGAKIPATSVVRRYPEGGGMGGDAWGGRRLGSEPEKLGQFLCSPRGARIPALVG